MIDFAPTVFHQLTYNEAWLYCATLEYDGHKDWRMPTFLEWCNRNELLGWYEYATESRYATATVYEVRAVCPVRDI